MGLNYWQTDSIFSRDADISYTYKLSNSEKVHFSSEFYKAYLIV